jgi:tetratricopeptide (TPR) repeat protein
MKRVRLIYCVLTLFLLLAACAGSADARRDRFLSRGRQFMKHQEYSRAILEFKNAIQAKPKDAEPYYLVGEAYSGTQDYRSAVLAFRKALQLNPKHYEAQLRMAQIFALTDDKDALNEAQEKLRVLLTTRSTAEVLSSLAFTEMKLGNAEVAMQDFEKALAQAPDALNTSFLLSSAKLLQKDAKGAEEVLLRACQSAPKSSAARRVLGEFYLTQKRLLDAEAQFRQAFEMNPKDGQALMDLARLQFTLGRKPEAEQNFRQAAMIFDYRGVYGVFLFQEGRVDEAIREFEKVFKEYPEDRLSRTRLIVGYRMTRRSADVDRILQEALKKNRKDLDAVLQWSEILIERGKYPEAESSLNQAFKLNRTSPEVHYLMAKLHQARGNTLLYRQELGEALRLNPSIELVRVELARDFINANDGHRARDILDGAPEEQKSSLPLVIQRNWAFWILGDLASMRQGIDLGLSRERSADFLIQDGLWRLRSGDALGARKSIEEALKLDPTDLRALSILPKTYSAEKNGAMAISKIKEYAVQQPKSAAVQDFLGTILLASGDRNQAKTAFAAAVAADPAFVKSDLSIVKIEVSEGKIDAARSRLAGIIAKDASNLTARLWLGDIEVIRGDNNAAIDHFQQVVNASPRDPQALNNLAYLLAEHRQKPDEALKYAQQAVELAPQRPAYCDTLGWVLYRKGLYGPSVKYLEMASTSKQNVVWKYHLAMAYAKSGDRIRGKATLEAALKLNPNVPEAKLAQSVVGEIR